MKSPIFVLAIAVLACAAGCATQQPGAPGAASTQAPAKAVATPEQPKPESAVTPEQLAVVAKADLDPKVLPQPRASVESSPDLSGAVYAINAMTLDTMTKSGVPDDSVSGLRKLDGKVYRSPSEFLSAAGDAIGAGPLAASRESILRSALVVTLADPLAGPRGQASLDEATARSQVGLLPATPVRPKATEFRIVYFEYDRASLKPESRDSLKQNADQLIASKAAIVVEGHCDERGTNEYNLALGERRAEAVRQALIADGVPASQMKTISYGEEKPVDPGHDEAAWSKNRRVVLTPQ
jgi:peptidoglycan-associated lipoprotein